MPAFTTAKLLLMNAYVLPDVLDACDHHRKNHPLLYLRGFVFSNLFLPAKKRWKVLWLWIDQNFLHLFFWSGLKRCFEDGRISRQCPWSVGVGCSRHIRSPCSLQILTQACCTESMKEISYIFSKCLWLSCWNPGEVYVIPQPIILLDLVIIWRLISDELRSDNFINFLWSLIAGWQVLTMWGWRFCTAASVILIIIKFTMTGNLLLILWFPGNLPIRQTRTVHISILWSFWPMTNRDILWMLLHISRLSWKLLFQV